MVALIIIAVILAVIMLIPIGADAAFSGGVLSLGAKVGPIKVSILPAKEKKDKDNKSGEKKDKSKKTKEQKKEPKPKKKLEKDLILHLIKTLLKAADRFRRKLDIGVLHLRMIVGGDDPYKTAMTYGYATSACGVLLPLADDVLDIKKKEIDITCDFDASKTELDARLVLTIRIWQLIYIAAAFGIEHLKWKRKKKKTVNTAKERNGTNGNTHRRNNGSGDVQNS